MREKTTVIAFRVNAALLAAIDKVAEEKNQDRAAVVKSCVEKALMPYAAAAAIAELPEPIRAKVKPASSLPPRAAKTNVGCPLHGPGCGFAKGFGDWYCAAQKRSITVVKALLLAVALLFAASSRAQTMIGPPRIDKTEWALLAVDAGVRGLDSYSTRRALQQGNVEATLPGFIANRTGPMVAYSEGMVVIDWLVARELIRRRHRKLAYLFTLGEICQVAPGAIKNLTLPDHR